MNNQLKVMAIRFSRCGSRDVLRSCLSLSMNVKGKSSFISALIGDMVSPSSSTATLNGAYGLMHVTAVINSTSIYRIKSHGLHVVNDRELMYLVGRC